MPDVIGYITSPAVDLADLCLFI